MSEKEPNTNPAAPGALKRDKRGTPFYDVVDPSSGTLLIRVANYHDPVVDKPEGMSKLLDYLPVFQAEVIKQKWASFVLDSVSFVALSARKYHQYDLNPDTNNPLQWYGGASDLVEELLCLQLPALTCNVGVAFHIHRRKVEAEGTAIRQPFVPGKRMEETKMVAAAWPELYRLHVLPDKDGKKRRHLQTESNDKYQAGTCIGVPDEIRVPKMCTADFLWQGWDAKQPRPPMHLAVYADPHVGKSFFLAGVMPRPCYVALFDAVGKDFAYRVQGVVAP